MPWGWTDDGVVCLDRASWYCGGMGELTRGTPGLISKSDIVVPLDARSCMWFGLLEYSTYNMYVDGR